MLSYVKKTTGWRIKMSLFFFGDNFYKDKETFNKIFSQQILEIYRILFVETTLEAIMIYYTSSLIIPRSLHALRFCVPAHSRNTNIKVANNSIEHFLWNPSYFSSDYVVSSSCNN